MSLNKLYIVALVAAPLGCLLYITVVQNTMGNTYVLSNNLEKLFYLIVLFPIIEELAFRGVVQEYFLHKTNYHILSFLSLANLITSFLFVLIHFVAYPPQLAIFIMVPSLIFGYFREEFHSVYPSIILHIFYNLNYFLLVA